MNVIDKYLEFVQNQGQCPEGEMWCPIQKRCVPTTQSKGDGEYRFRRKRRSLIIEPPDRNEAIPT